MSVEDKIKDRLDTAVVRSYYKPWHKRWWGRTLIVILIILVFLLLSFAYNLAMSFWNLRQGKIFSEDTGQWITQQDFVENQKELAYLLTEDDPWLGSEEPFVYVISFESFGCPICQENQKDTKELIAKYGSIVRFIRKDFPLEGLYENVFAAHLAAACAQEQDNYWEYSDLIYSDTEDFSKSTLQSYAQDLGLDMSQFDQCVDDEKYAQEIRQDYAAGVQAGAVGTPTFIINGVMRPGAIPIAMWDQIIAFIVKEGY